MDILFCALALLSGVVGAGFASGRELVRFFACHGFASGIAILSALAMLAALFLRLCTQLAHGGVPPARALPSALGKPLCRPVLCAVRAALRHDGRRDARRLCGAFRPDAAHTLRLRLGDGHDAAARAHSLCKGHARAGAHRRHAQCALPFFLLRLLRLPVGEACFEPVLPPDSPLRALTDGALYGALNAAMLAGELPMLLTLSRENRRRSVALFCLIFGAMLMLGVSVCRRHMQSILLQPLPFVWLSRSLGVSGYRLVALCLYAAALSTLCAMLCAAARMLLPSRSLPVRLSGLACLLSLLFALWALGILFKASIRFSARCARRCCFCSSAASIRRQAYPTDSRPSRCRFPAQCAFQRFKAAVPPAFVRIEFAARG